MLESVANRSDVSRHRCALVSQKQVDPERKLAPSGELSPGPGAYLSDSLPIPPLTVTLTGSDASKPRVKYPLSTTVSAGHTCGARARGASTSHRVACSQRNPPLASMSHTEPRFETGPFGRYEMGKAGVDNPVRVTCGVVRVCVVWRTLPIGIRVWCYSCVVFR